MALLTKELQEQVVKLLVSEGLVSAEQVQEAQDRSFKNAPANFSTSYVEENYR